MEDAQDSQKTDRVFLVFVGLIVLCLVGFLVIGKLTRTEPKPEQITYNQFTFTKNAAGLWETEWQNKGVVYTIPLRFNPLQAENVTMDGSLDERFRSGSAYVTFDPNETNLAYVALAAGELSLSMVRSLGFELKSACSMNYSDTCAGIPIVTCNSTDEAVVYLKLADEPRITLAGNCMTIQGRGMELLRAVDKALYIWYGIIK